jgi:peptidylprolyl isomerase
VILFGASGRRLKPLPAQAHASRESVQLLGRIGLQMASAAPASPVPGREGVIDVDAHWSWSVNAPITRILARGRATGSSRYGCPMSAHEKPEVIVPSDQPPSYQLELEDIAVGDGDEAVPGRVVEVHYVGVSWKNGRQFDASWDRGDTFKFRLGKGEVIAGWDQGVTGMKVGGRRRITIPPMLAYGKRGAGRVIGADETLVFVVDLISVR